MSTGPSQLTDRGLLTPLGKVVFKDPNNLEEMTKRLTREHTHSPAAGAALSQRKADLLTYQTRGLDPGDAFNYSYLSSSLNLSCKHAMFLHSLYFKWTFFG